MNKPTISVIVPTTCDARRTDLIYRAVGSVLTQGGIDIELILVVNGSRVDETLLTQLSTLALKVLRLSEGNVSKARYRGLQASTGEFFSFLDDDDEFLPGAMVHRFGLFGDGVDCVVTNGWERTNEDRPLVTDRVASLANQAPDHAFLIQNWFASPGSMFRKSSLDISIFNIEHKFFEWSLLFFRLLSASKTIRYDNAITYRKWEDNPTSASRTMKYKLANADFLGELCEMNLRPEIIAELRKKYQTALNSKSLLHLSLGQRLEAWRAHLQCVKAGGWRYLPFTRKLLLP